MDENVSIVYRNVTQQKLRPFITFVYMNDYGMVISRKKDYYYNNSTKSHRTIRGLFIDDHYTDYNYKSISPNEARTFSTPRPSKAKYMLVVVEIKYELTETRSGTW